LADDWPPPTEISTNAQPINSREVVYHLLHLLFNGQERNHVFGTFPERQLRILKRVILVFFCKQEKNEGEQKDD
jgi:hypothetical protein